MKKKILLLLGSFAMAMLVGHTAEAARGWAPPPAGDTEACKTVVACDNLIADCFDEEGNPGSWACHAENRNGACTFGTCVS